MDDASHRGCENCSRKSSLLWYSDATLGARDLISRQDDSELLDKSYRDGSLNEICALKLDQGKIDEPANDYCAEKCVPSCSRESAIQNQPYEETVKSDGLSTANEDESRCKSSRKGKTRRKTLDGIIIDLTNDIYGTASRSGIRINVISMRDLASERKRLAIPKYGLSLRRDKRRINSLSSTLRKWKKIDKIVGIPVLAIFYAENRNKLKKGTQSVKHRGKSRRKAAGYVGAIASMRNALDVDATFSTPSQPEDVLNERWQLHNLPSLFTPDETFDSTEYCCHDDNTLVNADNARHPPAWTAEQIYIDAWKHIANSFCSTFNNEHREYRVCEHNNCNADISDFDAETRADWMAEYFYPEYTGAKECRECSCDSSEYHTDINKQHDCCLISTRAVGPLQNSAPPKQRQREEEAEKEKESEKEHREEEEVERFGSGELRANMAPEFATEVDEYSPEIGRDDRCANCDGGGNSVCTIRRRATSSVVVVGVTGSVADLRDSGVALLEIDTRPGRRSRTAARSDDVRPNKSDSQRAADTRNARARRDRGESQSPERSSDEEPTFARAVDPMRKHGSIQTDAQQFDYKWRRRIATVGANTHTSVDFTEKRDSRHKSEEAIRVQLRESVEIRKRESLKMVEATSPTRSDNTNVDVKRRETRDHSLWTNLQMGKIWSQVHGACKNVARLVATSVGHIVRNAPKSERSQRNPVEVADATLVERSSSCADKICGEACRKNLMRSKEEEDSRARDREERVMQNLGKYCEGRERDRNITEFLPRNETYRYDEDARPRSPRSGSFTYLKDLEYSELRNRGGSDDNQDFAKRSEDKRESAQCNNDVEEMASFRHHRDPTATGCACCTKSQESRVYYAEDRNLRHATVCCKPPVSADCREDLSCVSPNDQLHCGLESTSTSLREDNREAEILVILEATGSRKKIEVDENAKCAQLAVSRLTEKNLMQKIATLSSTEANSTACSSWCASKEPVVSTLKWQAPLASRENHLDFIRSCRATKFRRKRSLGNKVTASVFKRKRNISSKRPSTTSAIRDNGMRITQIEPSTVQTARKDDKGRASVNIRGQTFDAIITRLLSEFLVGGESKKRVLMSITLQSDTDRDVSNEEGALSKEAATQTSLDDITSVGADATNYPNGCPFSFRTTSKIVQCFICDKQECYEIKHSDESISLEEALIAEYSETPESDDYLFLAERKRNLENSR